jgi:disulfide bond formation protein DsbB
VTDLAYDEGTDRFLVTTQHGVYLTDGSFGRVERYTVVDPGYSVDLGRFAAGTFLDSHTVMAVGENKSYVVLRESEQADAEANFRYFLESFDRFEEVARSRFGTVRARMMYSMAAAFDPGSRSVYTVTVPNEKVRRLVVSRFDRRDLVLSGEFMPEVASESGLVLGERRSLDEYYVTGAAIRNGRLYALSAAYSTLLVVDLAAQAVVAAYRLPGLRRPVGVALKGNEVYVATDQGRVAVYEGRE